MTEARPNFRIYLLNFIALIAAGISIYLTQHFFDIRGGTAGFKSICNLGSSLNCDQVAASSSAELFWGIPLSSLAAAGWLTLFFLSLFLYNRFWRREIVRALLLFSATAVGCSLFYLGVMIFSLNTFCLLCLVLDGLALAFLLIVLSLRPESLRIHKADFSKWKVILALSASTAVITVFILQTLEHQKLDRTLVRQMAESILESAPITIPDRAHSPSFGPADAEIQIVEFSDYQCPFCRIGALIVQGVVNRYPGQVHVTFRNFPMDAACNPEITHSMHPSACEAARIATCAHTHGLFKPIYESLFEHQSQLIPGKVADLLAGTSLDWNRMKGCIDSAEVKSWIAQDIEDAKMLRIQATPTFFVNGLRLDGAKPLPVWIQVIEGLKAKSHATHR